MQSFETGRQDNDAVISIKDTGIGISVELLPDIFDIFVQAKSSHESERGGLGIGLTLVRRLVELHGGTVEARSEGLGRGSEFVVRIPIGEGDSVVEDQDVPYDRMHKLSAKKAVVFWSSMISQYRRRV